MSATESWKMLFCFGSCIIFNLFFCRNMKKRKYFWISRSDLFHVVFCQTFSRFLFLTLFCSLVAQIIFNHRSFCRIYPRKGGVFIFSNYVVVAPIFAADYLQNSTLPSAKYPWSIWKNCLFSIAKHCGISTTVEHLNYRWKKSSETSTKWRERPLWAK